MSEEEPGVFSARSASSFFYVQRGVLVFLNRVFSFFHEEKNAMLDSTLLLSRILDYSLARGSKCLVSAGRAGHRAPNTP